MIEKTESYERDVDLAEKKKEKERDVDVSREYMSLYIKPWS